jgi:hypothetical protein
LFDKIQPHPPRVKTLALAVSKKNGGTIYLHADIGNSPRNTNVPAVYHPVIFFCFYTANYLQLQTTLTSFWPIIKFWGLF